MTPKEIKSLREGLEFTQKEFAVAFGVGCSTLSQYEIGFRKPGKTVALLLAHIKRMKPLAARRMVVELSETASTLKTPRGSK
jgi:DNA-binding transcriptional regulator YiaG